MLEEISNENTRDYNILLILTQNDLSDHLQTATQIVKLSQLPISVIIVGVGDILENDEYRKMEKLQPDIDHPLYSSELGCHQEREIV